MKMVGEIIVNGRWELGSLRQLITKDEKKAICSLPLSQGYAVDKLIWLGNRNGEYTVKSGYYLAKSESDLGRRCAASSSFVGSESLWKLVWSDYFPPKVKNFL